MWNPTVFSINATRSRLVTTGATHTTALRTSLPYVDTICLKAHQTTLGSIQREDDGVPALLLNAVGAWEACQSHHAPGHLDLQAHTTSVEAQHGADHQEAAEQPPLDARAGHGRPVPEQQTAFLVPALRFPQWSIRRRRGAGGDTETPTVSQDVVCCFPESERKAVRWSELFISQQTTSDCWTSRSVSTANDCSCESGMEKEGREKR